MSDLQSLALEFARAFNKAVRAFRMYSPSHPQVQTDLKDAFGWLEKMSGAEPSVALGTRDGVMIVQGRPVREMTPILKAFTDSLAAKGIQSFSFQRGATLAEFSALVDILVKKPEDVMAGDSIKPEYTSKLQHIRLNELRFVALEEGVSEDAVSALAAGGEQQQDLLKLISAFMQGGGEMPAGGATPGGGGGGTTRKPGSGTFMAISDKLAPLIRNGNAEEFVGLIDQLSGQLEEAGIAPEERGRRMSQLFKLLPVAEQVQKLRRILLMQEDAGLLADWVSALRAAGFDVEAEPTAAATLARLKDGSHWSGLVADAGFRGAAGVKFLDELATARKPVPVVLLSWDENLDKLPAVSKYPKLRYLTQPAEPPQIAAALDEIALPPEIVKPTQQEIAADPKLARELDRAHEIQEKLLPAQIPQPPGFEIAGQYLPAEHVGGDYYDVIQLPDGRVGLLIADVSGKGISAAMVMVMARTVFHAVAPLVPDAKSTVVRAADRISADLPAGFFLTLVYAVLDPRDGGVEIVNCGHMAPFLSTEFSGSRMVQQADASGAAMGLVKGPIFERSLQTCHVQLQPGETLVFFTDGVSEAMNEKDEEFTEKKLIKSINRAVGLDATELAQALVDAVLYHRGDAPASDDITLLTVRRAP